MLRALKHFEPREVQSILAGISANLLPESEVELSSGRIPVDPNLNDRVMQEIYHRLDINPEDESAEARGRIYGLLSREMSDAVLTGVNLKPIKERLGQRGDLRPDLYIMKVRRDVQEELPLRKLKGYEVKASVERPDNYEHLLPEHFGKQYDAVSVYVKDFGGIDPYTILVQTHRKGDVQTVFQAWKIYHSDVDLSSVHTPLEQLLAFIGVYGVPARFGYEESTFVLYQEVPRIGDTFNIASFVGNYPNGTELRLFAFFQVKQTSFEIAIGYAINMSLYYADLRKHK